MELQQALVTIDLLHGQIDALQLQVRERDLALREARHTIELQKFEIERLQRELFGDKSERFVESDLGTGARATPAPDDASYDEDRDEATDTDILEEAEDDVSDATESSELDLLDDSIDDTKEGEPGWRRKRWVNGYERSVGGAPRRKHLEVDPGRVRDQHEHQYPATSACRCCGSALVSIGEDLSTRIEREPVRFVRVITHRHKMACARCRRGGVTIAPMHDPPTYGASSIGASFAVDIVVQHYHHHMPFHRLAAIYREDGVRIDRSTLCRISGRVADTLAPIVRVMERDLLGSDDVVGMDGTSIKILAHPHCARRETYVLHGRGHVVFRVLVRKDAPRVLRGFQRFRGVAVGDAASVHLGEVSQRIGLRVGLCNVHSRRRFRDARDSDAARADHVLRFYRQVAMLERSWSDLEAPDRQREREAMLAPKFAALREWTLAQRRLVNERSPMMSALDYLLSHWDGLTLFLHDGRVPWHNNTSERLLRHIAVGRHAWMFRGTFLGARRAAVLWSLLRSCFELGVEPRRYLLDTLAALADTPVAKLWTLTPREYASRMQRASAA